MGASVPVRTDFSSAELRRLSATCKDSNQARRLLAIAAIVDGARRGDAARIGGMDRQTLRDWVIRFNEGGVDALVNQEKRPKAGYRGKLSPEQQQFLIDTIEMGPHPDIHEVVRWRLVDLCEIVHTEFGISFTPSGMWHLVDRLGYSHITARPVHYKQNPQAIETFKKTSQTD